jgi:hypothetical protein
MPVLLAHGGGGGAASDKERIRVVSNHSCKSGDRAKIGWEQIYVFALSA